MRTIQSDNPSVSHAFWRTRPIGPIRLLTAKLLAIAGCSLVTALPAASIFLAHHLVEGSTFHFGPPLSLILIQLPFLWLAVLFATFTPSTRHCLLASILALIVFSIVAPLSISDLADAGLANGRFFIAAILITTTAAFAIAHQYSTGRFARSLVVLSLGLIAASTTPYWCHIRFSVHETISPETESGLTRDITLRGVTLQHVGNSSRAGQMIVLGKSHFTHVPTGHFLNIDSVRQKWPGHGLTVERRQSNDQRIPEPFSRAALTGDPFTAETPPDYRLMLSRADSASLEAGHAVTDFSVDCTLTLVRPEITFTLPLRDPSRAVFALASGVAKVVSIQPAGNAVWVSTLPSPRTDGSRKYSLQLGTGISFSDPTTYLIHRPSGEITRLYTSSSTSSLGGFLLTQYKLQDYIPGKHSPRWLEDCELVQVIPRPIARFTRHFSSSNNSPP